MRSTKHLILIIMCLVAVASVASADDWLQFRGPGGLGIAPDKGVPVTWSADKNIVWKAKLPGAGSSSPIVVGNKVFLTYYTGYAVDRSAENPGDIKNLKRHLLCLDRASGKELWTREVAAEQPEAPLQTYLNLHGYASSTPVSDGKHVFVFFGMSGVLAYDLDGTKLWHKSVGKGSDKWGSGASPILHKDLVIVNACTESSALVALDKKTGNEMWRTKGITESWSTPILVKVSGGPTELVVSASQKVLGFDPDTGKPLWHADVFDWYVCPSVVAYDGVVYALQYDAFAAVKAGGRGDVTKSHTLWQKKFGAVVPSPVYHDGHLYWAKDTFYCIKASNGAVVYKERPDPAPDHLYGSPVLADGKIYYVSRQEGTFVVEASPKWKVLAHNTIQTDDSVFNASPAVSNSQLLLRSDRYLYCIGKM
jgi:outer membrane protein assembly factor BamB